MHRSIMTATAVFAVGSASAQQFFQAGDGTVDFAKAGFADSSDPANWDQISDSVAITRDNTRGIYNPLQEPAFQGGGGGSPSPLGTRWLFDATVQDIIDGTRSLQEFETWVDSVGGQPPSSVGRNAVLYLEAEDAYVDILFTEWGQFASAGGSFAYTRAIVELDMVCLADVNMDGEVTPTDFGAWLAAFNAGDPAADQNQDGMITPTDFGAWLANFNAGCD